jgi:hypothetical protein
MVMLQRVQGHIVEIVVELSKNMVPLEIVSLLYNICHAYFVCIIQLSSISYSFSSSSPLPNILFIQNMLFCKFNGKSKNYVTSMVVKLNILLTAS